MADTSKKTGTIPDDDPVINDSLSGLLMIFSLLLIGTQAVAGVIFRAEVAFFGGAVGAGSYAGIVHPAHQIVVVGLLAHPRQVGREGPADGVFTLAHRMAPHATARFE